ncbi:integrase [Herbaspirillum sp. RV1423]|uniref:integrase n=1 Tax=Herbaspirillum sp. RV1423 TaxID=1443993 RepID=UPI0012DE39D0|nr:integrase [Herbaspirillum sp. RV1423]
MADGSRPKGDFLISRRRDNTIVSRYDDLIWDISVWQTNGRRTILNFDCWKKEAPITSTRNLLIEEARWIMFSLIWLRNGAPLSVGSLTNFMSTVRALALYADDISYSIPELLVDETRLLDFSINRCSRSRNKSLSSLLFNLEGIGEKLIGFSIAGEKFQRHLAARLRESADEEKQTPPIPTRIYSEILSSLSRELSEWEKIASEALTILRDASADPRYGRRGDAQEKLSRQLGLSDKRPIWTKIASTHLRTYLQKKGLSDGVCGVASAVTQIQLIAKLTIQAFSGMRDDEARHLPYDCIEATTPRGGGAQRLIRGRTTKLSKGPRDVRWVTNKEGHHAIEIARKIAATIYATCAKSVLPVEVSSAQMKERPLLVSVAYTATTGKRRIVPADGHFFAGNFWPPRFGKLWARLQPVIETCDLVELEQIDEHRAWRSEKLFQIGSRWHLETHQLRRSLALYAQRSGLVSLPSLRRQLQHITNEMTRYYSRGSLYAKNIFKDGIADIGHFCFEWQTTQVESEMISYATHVLFTDEKLFGGHAAFIAHRLQGTDRIVTTEARAETVRMFKNGQLSYRETLIGGCIRTDECESPAVDWLNLECIANNCSHMVGSLRKLELVVEEQERLVSSLPPTSVLYRTENANLTVLVRARDKILQERKDGSK